MRTFSLVVALFGLSLSSSALHAQGYPPLPAGGYYINCPYGLSPYFPNGYGGVPYMGYEFDTEWRSTRADFPLPSLNWYVPVGTRDVVSRDGRAVWKDAQVRVSCWILNLLNVLQYHIDPIGYQGRVVPCVRNTKPGNTMYEEYDPYAPGTDDADCSDEPDETGNDSSGTQYQPGDYTHGETVDWNTGIGNGGYSVCGEAARVEYVCIQIWNDIGQRWETYSCGFATTC